MQWYAKTFKDDFSLGNSYQELIDKYGEYSSDPNLSARNMIGLEYHNYYKAGLLQLLSAGTVQRLTIGEMLILDDGEIKTVSGIVPTFGLDAMDNYLESLIQ